MLKRILSMMWMLLMTNLASKDPFKAGSLDVWIDSMLLTHVMCILLPPSLYTQGVLREPLELAVERRLLRSEGTQTIFLIDSLPFLGGLGIFDHLNC